MSRSTFEAAKLAEAQADEQWQGQRVQCLMITPTYREDAKTWQFRPRHMSEFLRCLRRWLARQGIDKPCPYAWVAERQERGVLHYHLLLWLPAKVWLPAPDRAGWWPHGSTRTERARRAVAYLGKYASKEESKSGRFPKGCRIHGCGGLDLAHKNVRSYTMMPRYVRDVCSAQDRPQRCSGGYVLRESGEFIRSPWRLVEHSESWARLVFEYVGGSSLRIGGQA